MANIGTSTKDGQINGVIPAVGDVVYDIVKGRGTIVQVEPEFSFSVVFPNGARQRYTTGGYFGGGRRIYWDNPIIVEPRKDDPLWETYTGMATDIYNRLGTIPQ